MNESKRLVVGVGNPDRGDDAAGLAVAAALQGRVPDDVQLEAHRGEMTDLLDRINGRQAVYFVDAATSGADPGTIHRFDAANAPLPGSIFSMSTHGFGVAEAIEMARALGSLPPKCVVFAVEAENFDAGEPLSAPVAAAIDKISDHILKELASHKKAEDNGHA